MSPVLVTETGSHQPAWSMTEAGEQDTFVVREGSDLARVVQACGWRARAGWRTGGWQPGDGWLVRMEPPPGIERPRTPAISQD